MLVIFFLCCKFITYFAHFLPKKTTSLKSKLSALLRFLLIVGQEKRCRPILGVCVRDHIQSCKLLHSIKSELFVDICVEALFRNHVQKLTNLNFFESHCGKLGTAQSHIDSVVHVRPLGGRVHLVAIISISLHEIGCFGMVSKGEFFGDSGPAGRPAV